MSKSQSRTPHGRKALGTRWTKKMSKRRTQVDDFHRGEKMPWVRG